MFKKIYIEITNVCNLKCKFCPKTKRKNEFMSVCDFEKIIKKVHNYTNLVSLHVKGEPLLHPELKNILAILVKYNLKTNITTNGTLIKEKQEILKHSKAVRQLNISLHSVVQNNVEKNYESLKNIFSALGELSDVIISYRLWNLQNIKDNSINKKIIECLGDYYNVSDLEAKLSKHEFLKLRDNFFINQDLEFTWPNIKSKPFIESGRCLALKEQVAILVDGTVVPCCLDNDGDISLGNILEESLEEILVKPKSVLIKKNFENGKLTCDLCKTCGFLKRLEEKRKENNMGSK